MLLKAIQAPFTTIMNNAGFQIIEHPEKEGIGVNVVTGKEVNMIDAGIIDPVLVTKSALKNAVSVVMTIVSADCVISNARADESSKLCNIKR
jgi:chaperonin GroEL